MPQNGFSANGGEVFGKRPPGSRWKNTSKALNAEHRGPFIEWQVGRHDDRATLVALAEELERVTAEGSQDDGSRRQHKRPRTSAGSRDAPCSTYAVVVSMVARIIRSKPSTRDGLEHDVSRSTFQENLKAVRLQSADRNLSVEQPARCMFEVRSKRGARLLVQ